MAPTLEREVPMAPLPSNPSDPSLSQDDENRLRVNAGLPGQNVYALTTEADLAEMLERVSKAGQLLVVDYYAPWCRIAREEKFRNVEFASVDFDRSDDLVKSRSVNSLPTMEIYRGQDRAFCLNAGAAPIPKGFSNAWRRKLRCQRKLSQTEASPVRLA
eukprot:g16951.t1